MSTLSTKHPIALTAASLFSAPYYLQGYIEAAIEEKFPIYVDDRLSTDDLEKLEQAIEHWSAHTALEIIRGEEALAQSQIQTLIDLAHTLTLQEKLPSGFHGKLGFLVERSAQINDALLKTIQEGRGFILTSKRWDEINSSQSDFWKQSFFLPPAWEQTEIQAIRETRASGSQTAPLLVYNTLEWLQTGRREALVEAIKKTSRCLTLDTAASTRELYVSLAGQASAVLLESRNPSELHAWIQLCEELEIPCHSIYGLEALSPIRTLAYGIGTQETQEENSLRAMLSPTIELLKTGETSLEIDAKQMKKALQELKPKRIISTLEAWLENPETPQSEGTKFFFYALPREKTPHIDPLGWAEQGICNEQTGPNNPLTNPERIQEGFLLLKNHEHWMNPHDERAQTMARQCINAYLFRQPNAIWQRDFHAIWSQWNGFLNAAEAAVERFYEQSPKNKNAYTQIAHGILLGIAFNDEGSKLLPKAQQLIEKDKALGRYQRVTPHEEVLAQAFQLRHEQAEAILSDAYANHEHAFDGYKVLGQWSHAYASKKQALSYYQQEKAEGRRSQECTIQHALIRAEEEHLETAASELEISNEKSIRDEEAFIELVMRYMHTRFASLSITQSLPRETADWSYIAQQLSNPNTRKGHSVAALAKGLTEGLPSGNAAFGEHNTHPMHGYFNAILQAAYGNWEATHAQLAQLDASIAPDLPIQVWTASQGLLASEDQREKHQAAIREAIKHIQNCIARQSTRTPSQYGLLAKLHLYSKNKDAALDAMHSMGILGSPGWKAQCSAWLTWMGHREAGAQLLNEKHSSEGLCSNHHLFYLALAHTLQGKPQGTKAALERLASQSPNYFKEQSAFRPNILFCEVAIAKTINDPSWTRRARSIGEKYDPWFHEKNKTWESILRKPLTPA